MIQNSYPGNFFLRTMGREMGWKRVDDVWLFPSISIFLAVTNDKSFEFDFVLN